MDYLNILGWLGLGGIGAISIAFYLLGGAVVLSTAGSVINLLSPIIKGAVDFVSWYMSTLWEGLKTTSKNLSTVVLIATIAGGTAFYTMKETKKKETVRCEQVIKKQTKKSTPKPRPKVQEKPKGLFDDIFG